MAKVQDYNPVVSKFELQSRYYVHFLTYSRRLNSIAAIFLEG